MEFQPHRSFFRVRGILAKGDDIAKEGVNSAGVPYRSVHVGVRTSPTQIVYCDCYGTLPERVYAWDQANKRTVALKYGMAVPAGCRLIKPAWDVIQDVYDMPHGSSVVIGGEINYREWNDKTIAKLTIKNVYPASKPVDFDSPDFKEDAIFSQEMVLQSTNYDKSSQKIYLYAWVFQRHGRELPDIYSYLFTVYPEKNSAFGKKILTLSVGDAFKANGRIRNMVSLDTMSEQNEWGENTVTIKQHISEYEITGISPESYRPKAYKEQAILEAIAGKKKNVSPLFEDVIQNESKNVNNDDELPF